MAMQVVLRPYVSAGVAVAGASLIAVTPVVPPPLELQERAVQLSAAVDNGLAGLAGDGGQAVNAISGAAGELTGGLPTLGSLLSLVADPFPTIGPVQVLTDASANLSGLAGEFLGFPLLTAILSNWAAYGEQLALTTAAAGEALTTALAALPAAVQTALTDLVSGNIYGAVATLFDAGYVTPLVSTVSVLGEGIFPILSNITANLNVGANQGPDILSTFLQAGLYPINAALAGAAGVTDNIVGDLTGGNFLDALENVALAPSTVIGAFLNGYQGAPPFGSLSETFGLLTNPAGAADVPSGTIYSLLALGHEIAGLIHPFTPMEPLFAADAGVPALAGALDPSTVATDLGTVLSSATADLSSMLNPADITGLFDPGAVTDIASMLSADLAPNLGGTLMDIPSMLLSLF
jgi:hypothetical protein